MLVLDEALAEAVAHCVSAPTERVAPSELLAVPLELAEPHELPIVVELAPLLAEPLALAAALALALPETLGLGAPMVALAGPESDARALAEPPRAEADGEPLGVGVGEPLATGGVSVGLVLVLPLTLGAPRVAEPTGDADAARDAVALGLPDGDGDPLDVVAALELCPLLAEPLALRQRDALGVSVAAPLADAEAVGVGHAEPVTAGVDVAAPEADTVTVAGALGGAVAVAVPLATDAVIEGDAE